MEPIKAQQANGKPKWRTARESGALPADSDLCGWLEYEGSLTRRLKASTANRFSLEIVAEGAEPASDEDRRLLDVENGSLRV